jgi:predicted RNase H-like HicB family nuclease
MGDMKYAVVIERGANSFGSCVPDLPGHVAVRRTRKEAVRLIREAIDLHIQAVLECGEQVPRPSSPVEFVHVAA